YSQISFNAIENAEKRINEGLNGFEISNEISYERIPEKMSECASFLRDKNGCVSLLSEINGILSSYPLRHKSLSDYFRDFDMLLSAKALLETILAEMPLTGSRGGSVFIDNDKIIKENKEYRNYLTVTDGSGIVFKKVKPIPVTDKPFESYLNTIQECEL
ncbi:MAG: hypothetical protein IJB45_06720, partial [Clostridia bacterium]|nr:hypothetical protein [Clostridia bacterium]